MLAFSCKSFRLRRENPRAHFLTWCSFSPFSFHSCGCFRRAYPKRGSNGGKFNSDYFPFHLWYILFSLFANRETIIFGFNSVFFFFKYCPFPPRLNFFKIYFLKWKVSHFVAWTIPVFVWAPGCHCLFGKVIQYPALQCMEEVILHVKNTTTGSTIKNKPPQLTLHAPPAIIKDCKQMLKRPHFICWGTYGA